MIGGVFSEHNQTDYITSHKRECNDDGTWGPVDDSNCTTLDSAIPTLLIVFEMNVSQADAQNVVDTLHSLQSQATHNHSLHRLVLLLYYHVR